MVMKMLRKKAKTFLAITACLIVPAFVLWGGATAVREQRKANFAGTLFGRRVSFDEYTRVLKGLYNQAKLLYGDKFGSVYNYLNLNEEAWNKLILLKEAERLGIKVRDAEVIAQIESMSFFSVDGAFSKQAYEYILRYTLGTDARRFEEEMRDNIKIAKLIDKIGAESSVSDEELAKEYKKENEKARISYVLISHKDFEGKVSAQDAELEQYYKAHSSAFLVPEQVNVEYIAADNKKSANEISDFLVDSPDLRAAAEKFSLAVKETGYFSQGEPAAEVGYIDEFNKTAFELAAGQTSDMIKAANTYYFIRVKDKKAPHTPELEEIKEMVSAAVVKEKAEGLARQKAEEYAKDITEAMKSSGAKFADAASGLSLAVEAPPPFGRRSASIEGLNGALELSYAVFNLNVGELTQPVRTDEGFLIAHLEEFIPIEDTLIKEDMGGFKERLLARKRLEHFNGWFAALKERANLKSNIEAAK